MNKVIQYLAIFIISLMLCITGCSTQETEQPQTISSAERALAMLEVQNIFSKHAYYHQVGKHCEEIEDIWVAEDGPNAETARWTLSGRTLYKGIDKIKYEYCTRHLDDQKKTLEDLSKKVPSIRNIPDNIGAGSEYVMHTQETPVIEVAGDGKTAKGIWYSIGLAVRGSVDESGNTSVATGWMWEKYGVDFIREDGEWKIWHLINLMDQGPAESQGRDGHAQAPGGPGGPPPGGPGGGPGEQGDDEEQVTGHFSWSPTAVPRIDPPFPEPYYTFSETFSY